MRLVLRRWRVMRLVLRRWWVTSLWPVVLRLLRGPPVLTRPAPVLLLPAVALAAGR